METILLHSKMKVSEVNSSCDESAVLIYAFEDVDVMEMLQRSKPITDNMGRGLSKYTNAFAYDNLIWRYQPENADHPNRIETFVDFIITNML